MRGHPSRCPYIAGVPSSEGLFNVKRQNGSWKMPFWHPRWLNLVSPHRRDHYSMFNWKLFFFILLARWWPICLSVNIDFVKTTNFYSALIAEQMLNVNCLIPQFKYKICHFINFVIVSFLIVHSCQCHGSAAIISPAYIIRQLDVKEMLQLALLHRTM